MNQITENVLPKLLQTARNLYEETAALDETDSELQLWYNRGYADGMVSSMKRLGYDKEVSEVIDPQMESPVGENRFLPWGKAYQHGFEMGEKESSEVLEEKTE
ncbi:MAG: hypothetical protein P8179_12850 [Candidatus Thiodiazotropha sp.]|jgi:hypothetical protein